MISSPVVNGSSGTRRHKPIELRQVLLICSEHGICISVKMTPAGQLLRHNLVGCGM